MAYTVSPSVPYYSQASSKECWYIAYKMLYAHRFGVSAATSLPATIESMHKKSATNNGVGLPVDEFGKFAEAAGLVAPLQNTTTETVVRNTMEQQRTIGGYTSSQLELLLKNHGPLWVSYVIYGGHIVVAVGVDEKNVYYHDPQAGADRSTSILQFNRNLNPRSKQHQMMYLPTSARPNDPPDIGSSSHQEPPLSLRNRLRTLADRIFGSEPVSLP